MEIKFKVDDSDTLARLNGLTSRQFMIAWVTRVKQLAEKRAREKIGGGFGHDIANSAILTDESNPNRHSVYVGGEYGNAAEHAHFGGVIRARYRKYLAIPLDKDLKKKSPEDVPWRTPDGKPVWLHRKYGPGWVMLDYLGRGPNRKLIPKYALVTETKPQKPRPWWPDEWGFREVTEEFIRENF